jgi:hypothetical protein
VRSFRIIAKSPGQIAGYDDQIPGRSGWVEPTGEGDFKVTIYNAETAVRTHSVERTLLDATMFLCRELAKP